MRALNSMSGVLYYPIAASLGLIPQPNIAPHGDVTTAPQPQVSFRPYDINVTSTMEHEVEPSLFAMTSGGVSYSISTYARWVLGGGNHYRMWCSRRNNTGNVNYTPFELPANSSYTSYGDAFLDANTYGGGVAPGRLYNVGVMHNGFGSQPGAIALWYSDDLQYKLYAQKININGGKVGANFAISTFASDPICYIQPYHFIGDYQQTVPLNMSTGELWHSSMTGNPYIDPTCPADKNTQGDIWLAYVF